MAEKAVRPGAFNKDHPRYKWIALSNTTLGILMATINGSIVLISLPAIFKGIKINPLDPGNTRGSRRCRSCRRRPPRRSGCA